MTKQTNLVPKRRFKEFQNTHAWEERELKDISKIYDGTHQTPKYTDFGIKFVSVENINDIEASNKYISIEDYETQFKNKPAVGDIFMTRITAGVIGATAVIESDNPIAYYVSLALIKPSKEISSLFLSSYISTKAFKKELNKRIIHTAFPKKINLSDIGECSVSKPKKDEQAKIGNFFKMLDDTIAIHQRKLVKMKTLKSAYLSEMFPAEGEREPKRRFAGFTQVWEQHKLGELLELENGYAFKSKYFQDETTKEIILTPGNVNIGGGFQYGKGHYYDVSGIFPQKFIMKPGDIFVTMTDLTPSAQTLGSPAIIPNDKYISP